ncbi:hypothetical protein E2C01_048814 [Portunus trituberculatus]|uniref:Uncharacterized protein n=1 Tax=Portunus trituberculatus TaxID=210409 RepID=A0A5B7GC23_PORTR|nr:hypothetical protein [Portunus trituberculatus]
MNPRCMSGRGSFAACAIRLVGTMSCPGSATGRGTGPEQLRPLPRSGLEARGARRHDEGRDKFIPASGTTGEDTQPGRRDD